MSYDFIDCCFANKVTTWAYACCCRQVYPIDVSCVRYDPDTGCTEYRKTSCHGNQKKFEHNMTMLQTIQQSVQQVSMCCFKFLIWAFWWSWNTHVNTCKVSRVMWALAGWIALGRARDIRHCKSIFTQSSCTKSVRCCANADDNDTVWGQKTTTSRAWGCWKRVSAASYGACDHIQHMEASS